jgi:hypothetical protein
VTFKAGDKVKYSGSCETFSGKKGGFKPAEGVIMEPGRSGITNLQLTSAVQGYKEGSVVCLFTQHLELIPAEPAFTFADIQVGDKIRRTLTRETGTTEVREGVVTNKSTLYATDTTSGKTSTVNYILAYDSDGDPAKPQVVLELLERPEKELELWENREAGNKIVTYLKEDGLDRIFTKREDGMWDTLVYTRGKKLGKGFPRADEDIAAYLTKQPVTAEIVK